MPLSPPDIYEKLLSTIDANQAKLTSVQKPSGKSLKRELFKLVEDYQIMDSLQFRDLARQKDHPVRALAQRLKLVKDFEKMIADACKAATFLTESPTFSERIDAIQRCPNAYQQLMINKFADNYDALFRLQGWNIKKTWKRIYRTLCRTGVNDGKAKCVYLQGAVSSGKTSLMTLLSSIYKQHEIGSFGPQAIHSQFWLDNLYGKEIYLGDEAQANSSNIQSYLLLLEGNSSTKTEVKFGDKVSLRSKPVIIACNVDIYDKCPDYKEAILKRVTALRFKEPCPKTLQLRPSADLLIYVLRELLERHLCEKREETTPDFFAEGNYGNSRL